MTLLLAHSPKYLVYCQHLLAQIIRKNRSISPQTIDRHLWQLSTSSYRFYLLVSLSAVLITGGLIADNKGILLAGIMLVPWVDSMVAMAYAIAKGNDKLLRRASVTLVKGIVIVAVVGWLSAVALGLTTINSEILSHTKLSEINLAIVLIGGILANSRYFLVNIFARTIVSWTLVPAISVLGIGLAQKQGELVMAGLFVFVVTLVIVIFALTMDFLLQSDRYSRSIKRKI